MARYGRPAGKRARKTKVSPTLSVKEVISPRQERMSYLEDDLQNRLNALYLDPVFMAAKRLRFNIGDSVISIHAGLYYEARVIFYKGLIVPETMYPKGTNLPVGSRVPTVLLHFDGWSNKDNCEVAENELIRATAPLQDVDLLGMLVAHEWNLEKAARMGCREKELGVGVFLMEDGDYGVLENVWKEHSAQTLSFGQFCGREPGPYSTPPVEAGT